MSELRGFSVAMSPRDSKTIKRPFPLIPPANDSAAEFDSWPITESICPRAVEVTRNITRAIKRNERRKVTETPPNFRKTGIKKANRKVSGQAQNTQFYVLNERSATIRETITDDANSKSSSLMHRGGKRVVILQIGYIIYH